MSHPMLEFAHTCAAHLKKSKSVAGEEISWEVQEVYGRAGVSRRIGVTMHTAPDAAHPDVVGYRFKMGFPSHEARAKAANAINEVHTAICEAFGLQNDAAWKLLDKNSNDVWFTFVVNQANPEQSMLQSLEAIKGKNLFDAVKERSLA